MADSNSTEAPQTETRLDVLKRGGNYGLERPIFDMWDAQGHHYRIWANARFDGFEDCTAGYNELVDLLADYYSLKSQSRQSGSPQLHSGDSIATSA
jgi:hypothetical protein